MTSELNFRHASNLELFLDLVFVFAVTQITSFIAQDITPTGVAKGALLLFLVWWQWTAFVWVGTAYDLQAHPRSRLIVLSMIPATITMTVAIPRSLDRDGMWFAAAYAIVQVFVLWLQGLDARSEPAAWRAFIRYVPLAFITPLILIVGALTNGNLRVAIFALAAAVAIGSALAAATGKDVAWRIDPVHFAERHALIIIIWLGEVLVAIGANATEAAGEHGISARLFAAVVVTVAGACVTWWMYFAYVPTVVEHLLHRAPPSEVGRVARDVCSFGHVPIVFGIILYAIVAKHVVVHPWDDLTPADRWLTVVSAVLLVGAFLHIQWRAVRTLAKERFVALAVVALIVGLGASLPGVAVVGLIAFTLGVTATITAVRFRKGPLAEKIAAHHD